MSDESYLEWLFSAYQPKSVVHVHETTDIHRSGPIESLDVAVIQPVGFWTKPPALLAEQSTPRLPGDYFLLDAKCLIVPFYKFGSLLYAIRVDSDGVTFFYACGGSRDIIEGHALTRLESIISSQGRCGIHQGQCAECSRRSGLVLLWQSRLRKSPKIMVMTQPVPDFKSAHVRLFDQLVLETYRAYRVGRFVPLRPSLEELDDLDGPFRAPADAGDLEHDAFNVLGLVPGRCTRYAAFRVYFYDLNQMDFPSNTDPGKQENVFHGTAISQACRWSISEKYFNKTVKESDLMMTAIADQDGVSVQMALILAKRDPVDVSSGIFVSLVCSSQISVDRNRKKYTDVNLRLGQLFQLAIFNYASSHWGTRNAYNAASNIDLVPFYSKTGWVPRTGNEQITREFIACKDDKEKIALVEDLIRRGLYAQDSDSSYPMELMAFDLQALVEEIMAYLRRKYYDYTSMGVNLYDDTIVSIA